MAGKEIMVMTQADRDLIQRFLDEKRRAPVNPTGRGREGVTEHEEWLTPEVYIAKIANTTTGIPALVGSGGDADAVGFAGDEPGYADCTIYRILAESGTPKLRKVSSVGRRVYNIFPEAIVDTPWIPVTRDKFGSWLAMGSVGTVGTGTDGGSGEPDCGFLILDCPTPVPECCPTATMPDALVLSFSIDNTETGTAGTAGTLSMTRSGTDYAGTVLYCTIDDHLRILLSCTLSCVPGVGTAGGQWSLRFEYILQLDGSQYATEIWDYGFSWGSTYEGTFSLSCDPFHMHFEGLDTTGDTNDDTDFLYCDLPFLPPSGRVSVVLDAVAAP